MSLDNTFKFLAGIEQNNERDWFHAHQPLYKQAVGEFQELIQLMIFEISRFDDSVLFCQPKELMFRIARDTRFSADKSPYNTAFRAHISSGGKKPVPAGCFVYVRPGGRSFIAAGLFADSLKEATGLVRAAIAENGDAWDAVLSEPYFAENLSIKGTALKRVPKEFDPAHPRGEYLKFKSWYVEQTFSDAQVRDGAFPELAAQVYKKMKPLNDFLNSALADYTLGDKPF